jgi:hypothetical protein
MRPTTLAASTAAVVIGTLAASSAQAQAVLTGDTRLACEAVLCLATATRPAECTPSLQRYFSIRHRKWGDTVRARFNFLQLCPRTDNDPAMDSLVQAQSQGAGQCDAAGLNALGYYDYNTGAYVVPDTMPSYCTAYVTHPYTYKLAPIYVGTPGVDGMWFDPT